MSEKPVIYAPNDPVPRIVTIRGQKVILDSDLAAIYGVETFRFNEAVKRNRNRFPEDFAFQLTRQDYTNLISQNAISSSGHGGVRKLPWVFTEHGAVMAANILRSERAVQMSVFVVRAFIRLREFLASHAKLGKKLKEREQRIEKHHESIHVLFEAIQQLTSERPPAIGFQYIGSGDSGSERAKTVKERRAVYRVSRKGRRV